MHMISIQTDMGRRLMRAGVLLFLLGLMSGFALPLFTQTTLEFTTYYELVLGGIFLIGVSLLWPNLRLNRTVLQVMFWIALFGAFANWIGTVLGAAWNLETSIPFVPQDPSLTAEPSVRLKTLLWLLPLSATALSIFALWGLSATNVDPDARRPRFVDHEPRKRMTENVS